MKTIEQMIFENDHFKGTKKNESQYKKFNNLLTIAQKLERYQDDTFALEIKYEDPDDNTRRNCILSVTFDAPLCLDTFDKRAALAELMLTSDDTFVVANAVRQTIKYTFGVRGVWE